MKQRDQDILYGVSIVLARKETRTDDNEDNVDVGCDCAGIGVSCVQSQVDGATNNLTRCNVWVRCSPKEGLTYQRDNRANILEIFLDVLARGSSGQ